MCKIGIYYTHSEVRMLNKKQRVKKNIYYTSIVSVKNNGKCE